MKTRILGNNLEVSSIGFGAMDFSEFYGNGNNEKLLGRFISGLSSHQRH